MAKASFSRNYSIGENMNFMTADFKGDEKFCVESVIKVAEAMDCTAVTIPPEFTEAMECVQFAPEPESPAAFIPPCARPVAQLPVYDVTLKDGERIQIMELARDGDTAQYILVDCLTDEYRMNPTDTTEGGWNGCELRGVLNGEILDRFPDKLREAMVPFENGDLLRLPTKEEIFGDNNGKGQFETMKLRRNRIAFQGKDGAWEWYWLSSVAYSTNFCNVNGNGNVGDNDASSVNGVRPRFQLRVRSES